MPLILLFQALFYDLILRDQPLLMSEFDDE
jgi:hypothetical protein